MRTTSFHDKITVITGAASGIGRAAAVAAAARGARLALTDVSADRLQLAADEIGEAVVRAPYSAAKFGLRGVNEVLRFDLACDDIGVTLVCPGAVATPLVDTVDIVGIDRTDPETEKSLGGFVRRAVSSESAAESMLRAVEKGRHMAFTSNDVRLGWYGQRYFPFGHDLVMRAMNRKVRRMLAR